MLKVSLYLATIILGSGTAFAQTKAPATTPTLVIQSMQFNRDASGSYTAYVTVNLQPPQAQGNVNFQLTMPNVKTIEEVTQKIKPIVDQLADEAQKAADNFSHGQ